MRACVIRTVRHMGGQQVSPLQLVLVVQCPVRVVEVPVLADDCVCVNVFVIVGTSHHSSWSSLCSVRCG